MPDALGQDMRRRLLFICLTLIALAPASPAAAGPLVGMADDRILLAGGPAADAAVAAWAARGVDVVRIFAQWDKVSPSPSARKQPTGRPYDFSRIDAAVDRVRAAGMEPMLTLTGPGPVWGMQDPSRGSRRYRPSPASYAEFADAAAAHFAGRVHSYILWNEPNLAYFLAPQSRCTKAGCAPVSPHLYRDLVNAAAPAIRTVDPSATVLIGALAPRGSSFRGANAGLRPLAFLRALGCVDTRFRRLRSGSCAHFKPVQATALAYHPHSITYSPTRPFPAPDDANLASLPRVEATLDRLRRAGRLRVGAGIWLDEYGYQTNPPDRYLGVSAATQDRWLQEGAYRASRDPRVKLLAQYVWVDEPSGHGAASSGWQSGLLFAGGRAKPALAHFPVPFYLDAPRSTLWGQVRPGGAHPVLVQRRAPGAHAWTTVASVTTDARGYWSLRMRLTRGAAYRFVTADGAAAASMARVR
jgi:hypothetical protein